VRSHKIVAVAAAVGAVAALTWSANPDVQAQAPAGQNAAAKPTTPTPRLPDGTVNFGRVPGEKGVWDLPYITNMGARVIDPATGKPFPVVANVGPAGKPVGGRGGAPAEPFVPFQPWAAAMYNYNTINSSKYDPEGFCLPPGGPRLFATPYPAEIIQMPDKSRIFQVFEGGAHIWREIYTDGREHPKGDALPLTWLGHSVGHWEGDTLVVDVVGFHEGTWLDYFGHPHTDQLHVVEKYTRPNKETLHYEALIDDPGAYTKPFTVAWDINWNNEDELTEYICQENNRFLLRLTDDFGQPLFGAKPHKD
jgi:hypothetical protein